MLYQEFQRNGHRAVVLIHEGSNRLRPVKDKEAFRVYGIYLRSPIIRGARVRAFIMFLAFLPITLFRLSRFLASQKIDIVNIHYPVPYTFYFGILRRLSKWRLVVTFQGSDAHLLAEWRSIEKRLIRFLLESADRVTGVSSSLLDKAELALPGLRIRKTILANGAPLESIKNNSIVPEDVVPAKYIVTAGLLIPRKGIDILLEALARLALNDERIPLVIIGDGPERISLQQMAHDQGIADDVYFVGSKAHEQTIALIKRSSFFVLASRAEGLPLVLAEAMCCRKSVVATAVDGVPNIVRDGKTGILVPPDDSVALCAAIARLHRDEQFRSCLADNAYKLASAEFSWQSIASKYLEIYKDLS